MHGARGAAPSPAILQNTRYSISFPAYLLTILLSYRHTILLFTLRCSSRSPAALPPSHSRNASLRSEANLWGARWAVNKSVDFGMYA